METPTGCCPPSPNHQQFTLPSGVLAHKWQCDSPRAVLILQHGFGEYAERYVSAHGQLIPKLNAKKFEVWALDLRGHGTSPGDRGIVDVGMAVQDHLQMRRLAAARGMPIFLFGHSLGGLVVAASALKDSPSRIDGIILSSPALPEPLSVLGEGAIRLLARLMPSMQIPRPRSPLKELCDDADQVRSATEDALLYKGQISFLVAATALQVAKGMWMSLERWTKPTLVVHGTGDSYTDFRQSERLIRNVASENKTLKLVRGGYHELLNGENYEQVMLLILGWLDASYDNYKF